MRSPVPTVPGFFLLVPLAGLVERIGVIGRKRGRVGRISLAGGQKINTFCLGELISAFLKGYDPFQEP